jgi:hypothetical protein
MSSKNLEHRKLVWNDAVFIDTADVAERTGVCIKTVLDWIHCGKVYAIVRGKRRYLVRESDVAALLSPVVPTEARTRDADDPAERARQARLERKLREAARSMKR